MAFVLDTDRDKFLRTDHYVTADDVAVTHFVYSDTSLLKTSATNQLASTAFFLLAVNDGSNTEWVVEPGTDIVHLIGSDGTSLPGTISAAGTWTANT